MSIKNIHCYGSLVAVRFAPFIKPHCVLIVAGDLRKKNKEEKDMIIAVAGSGGKTTRVHKLAQYYRSLGKKVFVTTTTHMKKESDTVIPENIEDIRKQLNETGYCMAGMPATQKMR